MAVIKQVMGTRTAFTATGLSTLASATYVASNAYNNVTNQPLDLVVEVSITPGVTTGNKQAAVFAIASLDNTNYQSGPTSGTAVTDEPNLTFLGTVPLNTSSTAESKQFSVAAAYGYLPPYVKIVIKNDSGAAFTAGTLFTSEVSSTAV